MQYKLTVIILTYNESVHIERAIQNVKHWADHVVVLDSYSQDNTVQKAVACKAEVIFRKFDHYQNQRQYAIDLYKNKSEWVLFLDADEYLTKELQDEIKFAIAEQHSLVSGYYLPRRFIFMNKLIKYGGYNSTYLLRLFRPQEARVDGIVNEHIYVTGRVKKLKNILIDHNLKNIAAWISKHNVYAGYEARELDALKKGEIKIEANFFSNLTARTEWIRQNIWNKLPFLFVRPMVFFMYRYFYKLGFLDGKIGFIYHFLHAFWYRLIIDLKYIELKNKN